ncbi:MAG: hypothetical protein AAF585_06680 [Verrucomicrobiota bacterium]
MTPHTTLAQQYGINLQQRANKAYGSNEAFKESVARLKNLLPEVRSAYVPSGRISGLAWLTLPLGALLGVPVGFIAGSLVTIIALALTLGSAWLFGALGEYIGKIAGVFLLFVLVFGLGGFLMTFSFIGTGAAKTVAFYNWISKSRSVFASVICALLSTIGALIAYRIAVTMAMNFYGWTEIWEPGLAGGEAGWKKFASICAEGMTSTEWWGWLIFAIGVIIALGTAGCHASKQVNENKFCEHCDQNMKKIELRKISFPGARLASKLLERRRIRDCATSIPSLVGRDATPTVYQCPKCSHGYIEIEVFLDAYYLDKDDKAIDLEACWCAGSIEARPDQIEEFLSLAQR